VPLDPEFLRQDNIRGELVGADVPPLPAFEMAIRKAGFATVVG